MLETAATQQPSPSHLDHGSEDEQMARAMIEIQHILDLPPSPLSARTGRTTPPFEDVISDDDEDDEHVDHRRYITLYAMTPRKGEWT